MKKNIFNFILVVIIAVLYYFSVSGLKGRVDKNIFIENPPLKNEIISDASISECRAIKTYSQGQRVVYEISGEENDKNTNYGFVYGYCMPGTYTIDSGRTTLHLVPGINNEGYICKDIFENLQHSDNKNDEAQWHIKPVMRIKSGYPMEIPVARIEIVSYNGKVVKEISISTENFCDYNGNYNGDYKQKYLSLYQAPIISGENSQYGLNFGLDKNLEKRIKNCKVDFRVYWYGQVEVWFDKMIVEDGIANEMFDIEKSPCINFNLSRESQYFNLTGKQNSNNEFTISQIPCIKYIFNQLNKNNNSNNILSTGDYKICGLTKNKINANINLYNEIFK